LGYRCGIIPQQEEKTVKLVIKNPDVCGPVGVLFMNRAFDVAIREYGIDKLPGTVNLEFKPPHIEEISLVETSKGMAIQIGELGGRTYPKILPGNVASVQIMISPFMGVEQLMHTWAHELKHVAQNFLGEFVAKEAHAEHVTWLGTVYTDDLPWDKRPWEKDAEDAAFRIDPLVLKDAIAFAKSSEGKAALEAARQKQLLEDGTHGHA
jgi:hypothetical protein